MKASTVILTHAGADLDAISSIFAASKLYPGSIIINPGSLDINAQKIVSIFGESIKLSKVKEIPLRVKRNIKRIIIVDTKSFERIGEGKELIKLNQNAEIIVFDHHPGESDLKNSKIIFRKCGANTTILVDLLRRKRVVLNPFEATLIAFGIFEDTGSFSFPSTTQEDFSSMTYLFSFGVDMKIIHHYLSPFLGTDQINLLRSLLNNFEEYKIKGSKVAIAFGEMETYVPGLSLIAHKLIELIDVDVVFVVVKMKRDTYIIGRSTSPDFNLIPIISQFNGGGHPTAASTLVRDISFDEIRDRIINATASSYFPVLKAYHIMSSPVKTVHPSTTIKEALNIMIRMGYSGLPIEENGRITGMISKRDLEKVLFFEKRERPVKQFYSPLIIKVEADSDLREIEETMIKNNTGRVLVEQEGEIKGIISRSDLLRAYKIKEELSETSSRVSPSFFLPKKELVRKLIEYSMPKKIIQYMKTFGRVAEENSLEIFLVGGAVRDLFLKIESLDFDFVVSDALKFGDKIKKTFKGKIKFYQDTQTVHFSSDSISFDFATARREYYTEKSIIPIVEKASLKEDLARRDFTINAIALNILPKRFGEIHDFYGGYSDLANRKIRVLHSMSFIEDPSRILRAVKYMVKLGFSLSEDTEYLLRKALELNVLKSKHSQRILNELNELFVLDKASEAIKIMEKLGILENIFGIKKISSRTYDRISRAQDYSQKYNIKEDFSLILLTILLEGHTKQQKEKILNYLSLRRSSIASFMNSTSLITKFHKNFYKIPEEELFFILRSTKEYVSIAYLTKATGNEKAFIKDYFEKLRPIRIETKGTDLIRLGIKEGPVFRQIFDELLKLKIKGKIKNKHDEITYISKNKEKFKADEKLDRKNNQ